MVNWIHCTPKLFGSEAFVELLQSTLQRDGACCLVINDHHQLTAANPAGSLASLINSDRSPNGSSRTVSNLRLARFRNVVVIF